MRQVLALILAGLLSVGVAWAEDRNNVWSSCYVATSPDVLAAWKTEAEAGDLSAQFCLGVMFELGMDVAQDFERALHWYRLAADQGNPLAQSALGNMYYEGRGGPKNYSEAAHWYQLAKAQALDFVGFNALKTANSLDRQLVFAINHDKFKRMLGLSFEQDPASVLINLGDMFGSGKGVPKQIVSAHMYYNIACALGEDYGCERRDKLAEGNQLEADAAALTDALDCLADDHSCDREPRDAETMPPADIAEAQRRARVCMESNYVDCD
jgi:TPR repeat protein